MRIRMDWWGVLCVCGSRLRGRVLVIDVGVADRGVGGGGG